MVATEGLAKTGAALSHGSAMIDSPAKHHPKLFVLDTNVVLHDAGCIRNFEEN